MPTVRFPAMKLVFSGLQGGLLKPVLNELGCESRHYVMFTRGYAVASLITQQPQLDIRCHFIKGLSHIY